jgi:hypothetical protein
MTGIRQRLDQRRTEEPGRTQQEDAKPLVGARAWRVALRRAWFSGSVASLLCTLVVTVLGRGRRNAPARGTNATSHWVWGHRAIRRSSPSLRYTAFGYAIHHASSMFWAIGFERWRLARGLPLARHPAAVAATVATAAWVVDYKVVPKRLTPGFEHHLSRRGLAGAYVAFGAGLLMATWLRGR